MKLQLPDKTKWHHWYAWHPVKVNNTLIWLETVQRRWIPNASSAGDFCGYSFDVAGWEYTLVGSLVQYEASLDGNDWEHISPNIVDIALSNGYEIRRTQI